MSAQFRCGNDKRRQLIQQKPGVGGVLLNGIDYLEVLDDKAPADSPRQQTLLVRLFQPASGLTSDNVRIDGGVRITKVRAVWAFPANAVPPANAKPDEIALFAGLPHPENVLVVRVDAYGDYSTYRLTLVKSLALDEQDAPQNFDPMLSHVDFSFKVECKSDFDCEVVNECPPAPLPAPAINYLAKDYGSFRRVLLDRLAAIAPDWKERNPADLGVMLVELLAYAGDQLSYYQDAVATEAYLGTARQRISVRRHARLLDYFMHEGVNARAWLCVEVSAPVVLPRKRPDGTITAFVTRLTEGVLLSATQEQLTLLLQQANGQLFEPMHDALLLQPHNKIDFHTWSDEQCCLPAGATRATLLDDVNNRLALMAGDVLILEEWIGRASPNLPADADPLRRQAVRLTKVTPAATAATADPGALRTPGPPLLDPLTGEAIVEIEWHTEDALAFPLCVSTVNDQGKTVLEMSGARGNVILVDHGRTISEKQLNPPAPSDGVKFRPVLTWPEITHAVPFDYEKTSVPPVQSAASLLAQDPRQTVPAVTLADPHAPDPWTAKFDLLESDGFMQDFVVELDDAGYGTLRFGDGVLGKEPAGGLVPTYRVGRGRSGNVGAEAIAQVLSSDSNISLVRNPLPATGGVDPEPIDDVKSYAPEAFRVQERCVTEDDYAAVAMRHPDVLKARATRRWTGSWYTVFITIDRKGGRPLDEAFRADVATFMDRYRLAGEDIEVELPIFVPLDITLVCCLKPGYFRSHVHEALLSVFSSRRNPDGTLGFFYPDNFTFGQPVYLSQVVAAAMSVSGIDWVDPEDPSFVFQRFAELAAGEIAQGYIGMQRLEIARLDNDASLPENGRIQFVFMGGQ